jgi:acetyl esterase/lipase
MNIKLEESKQSKNIKCYFNRIQLKKNILNNVKKKQIFIDKSSESPTPPNSFIEKLQVKRHTIEGRNVYQISPKDKVNNKTILFIHGGAYLSNFQLVHWKFMSKIIKETGASIIAPDYPLAPSATWEDAFKMLDSIYGNLLSRDDQLILMGDSAGAGLLLGWYYHISMKLLINPSKIILLSPWLDISMTYPIPLSIEEQDPYLTRESLKISGEYWAGELDVNNWRLSPLNIAFTKLPPITIFTGSADILNYDSIRFKEKLLEAGLKVYYREFKNMMHNWMFFKIPEAKDCLNEICNIINH